MQKIQKHPMKNKKKENSKGFTLLEVLIALSILSIIAIFSFSSLYYFSQYNQRVREDSEIYREANLIISSIIDDMFPVKDEELALGENESCFFPKGCDENPYTYFIVKPFKDDGKTREFFKVGFTEEGVQLKDDLIKTRYLVTLSDGESNEFSYIERIDSSNHYKIFLKMRGKHNSPTFTTYLRLIENVDLDKKEGGKKK